jgi:spore coat protein A
LFASGQQAVFHYPMEQRAALLWYHDHVMGTTKFDVYAGLAGLWIVRDGRERELGLPEGPPFELPLLIQDRNFDLDDRGRLTGRLVHKTDPDVMEAFAPFTTVNGKVWPVLDVQPATYRFRVINGSNARTYRLVLVGDGDPELERITQIGTDHGLLNTPTRVPSDGLVLASAERADVLVDFSGLEPGSELTLLNTAAAPFDGSPFPSANAANATDLDALLPYPQVMRFRVIQSHPLSVTRRTIPRELATDYRLPAPKTLAAALRRAIALVERELDGEPNMLTMRELEIAPDDHSGPLLTLTDGEQTIRYRTVASHFEDATTFFPTLGEYEVWRIINLTCDTHPIHLHLDPFQILSRRPIRYEIPEDIEDFDIAASVTLERGPADELDHAIDDNERGLKDTIRVNPNEIVEIAVRFTTYAGRYMYHCHILEHEDRDMMRPFVTMPADLMPFMS